MQKNRSICRKISRYVERKVDMQKDRQICRKIGRYVERQVDMYQKDRYRNVESIERFVTQGGTPKIPNEFSN